MPQTGISSWQVLLPPWALLVPSSLLCAVVGRGGTDKWLTSETIFFFLHHWFKKKNASPRRLINNHNLRSAHEAEPSTHIWVTVKGKECLSQEGPWLAWRGTWEALAPLRFVPQITSSVVSTEEQTVWLFFMISKLTSLISLYNYVSINCLYDMDL